MWLGVDTGGTFTDFVLFDGKNLRVHKVLSTPQAPEQAILQGVRDLGLTLRGLQVVHGSTVATNAVLERKGVRTVYITNRGLRDVLTLGRQARAELYNLQPEPHPPPVPRELCLEVGARLGADGRHIEALSASDRDAICERITALQPVAVAINLLFSFSMTRMNVPSNPGCPRGCSLRVPPRCYRNIASTSVASPPGLPPGLAHWWPVISSALEGRCDRRR